MLLGGPLCPACSPGSSQIAGKEERKEENKKRGKRERACVEEGRMEERKKMWKRRVKENVGVGEEKRGCGWETGKERECGVRGREMGKAVGERYTGARGR